MITHLIDALSHPAAYPHATGTIDVVETHISWIFLTGSLAYKIKKPLELGFLDFSTIEKRHHFCCEELRRNQKLCPEIYLSVVPVVQTEEAIMVDGEGEIIDYAVKMVQFERTMEPGLNALERSGKRNALYTENFNLQTYRRLLDIATLCIGAELSVIVDATFLNNNNRKVFMALAKELKVPFRILHFCATDELLEERVQKRALNDNDASDANSAVLAKQLEQRDELTAEECGVTLAINTEHRVDAAAIALLLQSIALLE